LNLAHELAAVYDGRIEEIVELETTGKIANPEDPR